LAILQRASERRRFIEAIESADSVRVSVASFVEASIVIETRYDAEGLRDLDQFISRANIELIPVDQEQGPTGAFRIQPLREGSSSRRAELRRLLLIWRRRSA